MLHDARLAFLSQTSSDGTSDVTRLPICRVLNKYEQYYVKWVKRKNNSWNLRLKILEEGVGSTETLETTDQNNGKLKPQKG